MHTTPFIPITIIACVRRTHTCGCLLATANALQRCSSSTCARTRRRRICRSASRRESSRVVSSSSSSSRNASRQAGRKAHTHTHTHSSGDSGIVESVHREREREREQKVVVVLQDACLARQHIRCVTCSRSVGWVATKLVVVVFREHSTVSPRIQTASTRGGSSVVRPSGSSRSCQWHPRPRNGWKNAR